MADQRMEHEIREALNAGERALYSLQAAQEQLSGAKNWGIFDMLGGGFLADMMKHSRLDRASQCMEQAKRDLTVFQRELRDVSLRVDLGIRIGGFLSFADFFFDGLVADYLVQSRISEARNQVWDAIRQVTDITAELRRMLDGRA